MKDTDWVTIFNEVWDEYHKAISAYVHYRLPNDHDAAEDCVQNVFLTFFFAKDKIHSLKHIKAWLYRVADNYIKKEYSRLKKDPVIQEPIDDNTDNLVHEDFCTTIESKAFKDFLINNLSEPDKYEYMLFYEVGYSMKQIAKILNISVDAAKKRKERLKLKIANLLQKEMLP